LVSDWLLDLEPLDLVGDVDRRSSCTKRSWSIFFLQIGDRLFEFEKGGLHRF
jgi:hypothetical protein